MVHHIIIIIIQYRRFINNEKTATITVRCGNSSATIKVTTYVEESESYNDDDYDDYEDYDLDVAYLKAKVKKKVITAWWAKAYDASKYHIKVYQKKKGKWKKVLSKSLSKNVKKVKIKVRKKGKYKIKVWATGHYEKGKTYSKTVKCK